MQQSITAKLSALARGGIGTRSPRTPDVTAPVKRARPLNALGALRRPLPLRLMHVVAIGMVLVGVVTLMLGEAHARQALEERFGLRATLGARFVGAYTADILTREARIATQRLGGVNVSADAFAEVVDTFGFEAAVLLDETGSVLHVAPEAPGLIGTNLAEKYPHLRDAVAGIPGTSNGVAAAVTGRPIIAFAAPYESIAGRRVLSGGFYFDNTPLEAYLASMIPFSTASAYLIDGNGMIVESNVPDTAALVPLATENRPLSEAIVQSSRGSYQIDGQDQRFAVEQVEGSQLRLLLTVPGEQLYAPLGGVAQLSRWGPLLLLAAGALYLIRVLSALSRSQEALSRAGVELQRSNRELQEFASVASHDLQEPLRKIQAFGDRLSSTYGDRLDETGVGYLDRMIAAAQRMRGLIDDLLSYSRLGAQTWNPAPVALGALVTEVLTDLEARIEERGAEITVGALPTIEAEPLQMRQLFQNLIANGLKFVPAGTTPRIRVWAERVPTRRGAEGTAGSGSWRVFVEDNGVGFDEQYLDRIFAPFQRLHGKSQFEGTGMGLAICRRIAERHAGEITARSRPGEGATFVVTLPERQAIVPGATA